MDHRYLVIYCTCPNWDIAERIASTVVNDKLAACVNILPEVTSVYRWKDQQQRDKELLLIIKTLEEVYPSLEKRIHELHPYEVPEIIALPIVQGAAGYLGWINASVGEA